MMRMHRRTISAAIIWMMMTLALTGCTSEASNIGIAKDKEGNTIDTGFTASTVGSYDSADTAVVLSTDLTNKAVTLVNMDTGKQYTLYYDGTTYVKDKYDGPMTISQIKAGDVVDVTFLKGKKKLASIKRSPEAWIFDEVDNYDLAGANKTASIGSQTYSLLDSVVVLSDGRRVDTAEVVSQDVVTISGIEHKIYSVSVDKGHGYLSLKNEQPLLGGWIEVGNSVIRQVTEDMLLVVPEGSYQVVLSNNGIGCVKNVTIERDKEVVLDVDDIEIPEDKTGKILFNVTPETATVSVDGKPVDISRAVELTYGIHRVEAAASGYDTLTKHIQVGSEYATISFTLEETLKKEDNDRQSLSENSTERIPWQDTLSSVSDNTLSSVSENALRSSQNGKIDVVVKEYLENGTDKELEGVTVRLEVKDSNKKVLDGYPKTKTSPCDFSKNKDAKTYQFILSKDGYTTRTFEPDLEDYQKDETVYFWLQKEGSSSGINSTNRRFSSEVISAIATAGGYCDLTYGPDELKPDAYISSAGNLGNLWDSGKSKVNNAVTDAVKKVVGSEGIGSYYFKVADTLNDVVALASGDYEGTATVTVSRSGYMEESIPVRLLFKKKAEEEPSASENNIAVEVTADKEKIEPGETVEFIATVKNGEESIEDANVSWTYSDVDFDSMVIEDGNSLILEAGSVETTKEFTATATYTDANGKPYPSNSVTVEIMKESEAGTDEDDVEGKTDPVEPGTPSDPSPAVPEAPIDSNPTESVDAELTTQTYTITQEAHPIRNFFSSLFEK